MSQAAWLFRFPVPNQELRSNPLILDTARGHEYGPPDFRGGYPAVLLPARERVAAMASDGANRPGRGTGDNPSEAELSERLRRLGERLGPERAEGNAAPAPSESQGSDANGVGKAMRLSSEFIAGIIAGFGVGWLLDRVFGTSPWGLIVFLMLGFVAGLMNVM